MAYQDRPDCWQTKVQVALRAPFPLPWIAIAVVLLAIAYAVLLIFERSLDRFRVLALEAVIVAALGNIAVFSEILLDDVADTFPELLEEDIRRIRAWLRYWYRVIFHSHNNLLAGLVLGAIFEVLALNEISRFFTSMEARIFAYAYYFILGFLAGSAAWYMIGIAGLTLSLGRSVVIRASIFDTATSPLRAASSVLWKVSLSGTLIYILGISVYPICREPLDTAQKIVIIVSALALFLYFILPQVNIHKTLKKLKQKRLNNLVKQIDASFDRVATDPSMENISRLKELFALQKVVDGRRSWSFGLRELLTLISSILIPLILFALTYYRQGNNGP